MKTLFIVVLMTASVIASFSQTSVYLRINHHLGSQPFAISTPAENNLGNTFSVSRLQYYISEIKVIYDGGKDTTIENKWILADASTTTEEFLGAWNFSNIEGVQFSVGVDPAVNHLDPSQYPSWHPLAPKSPSMHWGWTAGYRFVAMEGHSGPTLGQTFEIHALGDQNYFITHINTEGKDTLGQRIIDLYGDYTMALKDIDMSSGLIYHGEAAQGAILLLNFNTDVFSAQKPIGPTGIQQEGKTLLHLVRNPIMPNERISIKGYVGMNAQVHIMDVFGNTVGRYPVEANGRVNAKLEVSGLYLVSLYKDSQLVGTQRLIVVR